MAAGGEQTRSAHARDVSLGARIKNLNFGLTTLVSFVSYQYYSTFN